MAGVMNRSSFFPLFLAFGFWPAICLAQATVEGRVELPKSRYAPVPNERYQNERYVIVNKEGVLATDPPRAVVFLEGNFAQPATFPTREVAQKDYAFAPGLLAIQAGTKVQFPNFDDSYHNIFSYSPAKRFDLGRYPPGETPAPSVIFDTPGLVTLRCDIHEHMRGLILVLNTPYFATSEPNGRYRLSGLPAGHFSLKAWIDSKTMRERPVDLKNGSTLRVDFP
jgi:plastocyanin